MQHRHQGGLISSHVNCELYRLSRCAASGGYWRDVKNVIDMNSWVEEL